MMKPVFVRYGEFLINLSLVESIEVLKPPSDTGGKIRVVMTRGHDYVLYGSQTKDFVRVVSEYIQRPNDL